MIKTHPVESEIGATRAGTAFSREAGELRCLRRDSFSDGSNQNPSPSSQPPTPAPSALLFYFIIYLGWFLLFF